MNTGNMNLEKPSIGSLDWGYPLNDNFDKIDDHDHSGAPKGKRIEGINLASTNIEENKILQTDGIGGFRYIDTPSGGSGGLGSKVFVVAENGGDFSSIAEAIEGTNPRDVLILNPNSSGMWEEAGLMLKQNSKLLGYGTEPFLNKVGNGNDVFIFNTNNFGAFLDSLWILTSSRGIVCEQAWMNVYLKNCRITATDIGTPYMPSIDANSYLEEMYTSFFIDNSYIYSNSSSNTATINILCQETGLGQNWEISYSRIVNGSDGPAIRVNVEENKIVNIWVLFSTFILDSGSHCIDKNGNGTLNIYVSNCSAIKTSDNTIPPLVNPDAGGTVNVYYMDL